MSSSPSRSPLHNLDGFILAGGKSSRFGSDKALALWNGQPLLAHAIGAFTDLGLTPRIVCRDPLPYFQWANAFVTSERPDLGPLEGLRVSLKSSSQEFALILTGDMPLIRERHLRTLLDATTPDTAAPNQAVVVFVSPDGIRHPFPGLYPRSALPIIETLSGGSSVQALLDRVLLKAIKFDPELAPALRSINTPEDLQSL